MAAVTIRQLLDAGVHFGHQTRRWNPKVKRFILTERSGIHIIDLQQSLAYIDKAYDFIKETVAHGGTVLFVGTKKQAQESVSEQATRVGQPYVNERWLGGLLTNFQTVSKRLGRMKELEEIDYEDTTQGYTKKELLLKKRELTKLQKSLGGIRTLQKAPSAIWVIDPIREHLAIDEAKKLGIPVVGILDSNADPDDLQYPIPGNDDAIRSVALLTKVIADAVAEGLIERHQKPEAEGNVSAVEPLAEWERELLEQSGEAPATATEAPATAEASADKAPAAKKPAAKAPAKAAAAKKPAAAKAPATKAPAAAKAPAKKAPAKPAAKPAAEKKPAAKATTTKAAAEKKPAAKKAPAKTAAKPAEKK
ncbi:MAG: 30S ribosomal protein S2 [Pontimonas sp.]|nr:30S ribosomal protein S2 [Pontimonas sp.]